MAQITASMVAELRSKTGAGMMDCKKALNETGGDLEAAVDYLRKKGLSAAAKKSGRAAAEGAIVAAGAGSAGVIVEVNAETDFVAKNDAFCAFAKGVAEIILQHRPQDVTALLELPFPGSNRNVGEEQVHQIATIGENINIRRFASRAVAAGRVESYIHGAGKIGVLVELQTEAADNAAVQNVARQLAMHVAAANPQYLCREQVPADVVEREKDIMRTKAIESGKPANIVDKIIEGQVNKFFGEVCLLEQAFVMDPDTRVSALLANLAKEVGSAVSLTGYDRYQLGEGLERRDDDFAAEVAALTQQK
ncbi:MAG: translation elongation factor Ts [Desulfuromonas thiophila]|jgi:elongation factor Ts|nr:translation elongation factor Ts [Desulfuromonas thiophila]MDD3800808.1 translation elongation factor Ts [Desulfuromonas thiophila]